MSETCVQPGQVWQVGSHMFVCGDFMDDPHLLEVTIGGHRVDLVYVDPPWDQANVRASVERAGVSVPIFKYLDMYRRIADFGARYAAPVFVEGSKTERARVAKMLPGPCTFVYRTSYDGGKASALHYSGQIPSPVPEEHLVGLDTDLTPGVVMRAHGADGLVVDMCAGRGLTSRQAEEFGWSSVNLEVSPYRVGASLERMRLVSGSEPVRIK